jgi:hypothetical protein
MSLFSIGSWQSELSLLSAQCNVSVLSFQTDGGVLGRRTDGPLSRFPSTPVAVLLTVAAVAWAAREARH